MNVYNIFIGFISAAFLFFSLYQLFTVIFIHKRLLDKHFYFSIASFFGSVFGFFQIFLTFPFADDQYLLFHKVRFLSALYLMPFSLLTLYSCYFRNSKKTLPVMQLALSVVFSLFAFSNISLSLPINTIEVNLLGSKIFFHTATSHLIYKIWAISALLLYLLPIFFFIISKDKEKRILFVVIIIVELVAVSNDAAVTARIIHSFPISVIFTGIVLSFVFIEFLFEDRKTYLSVFNLSKQLQKEKDEVIMHKNESERRLRITEIYTRKSLVESIEKGEDPTKFPSKNIQIATLFSDIRDFTGITEGLPPLETVELLNAYFNRMNSTIIKHNGEIDKLMGDCIMALFKNPDDALKSAIDMRYELEKFNEDEKRWTPSARWSPSRKINNGIGLNYGEVIIGNIGSESKMDYTVVGDIVNTASRLEALTKYYKVPLIISEDLKIQLNQPSEGSKPSEGYCIRFLDEVLVKGKSNPLKIYEVFDFEPDNIKEMKIRNQEKLDEAFEFYKNGNFIKAIKVYEELSLTNSEFIIQNSELKSDPALDFFISRCRNLQIRKDAGLLKDWNGVFEFMDK
jgi:class 3 adenylate cyclase